jgi:hypothetical protein
MKDFIDLESIERNLLKGAERGIPNAEIVDAGREFHLFETLNHRSGEDRVLGGDGFGQLDVEDQGVDPIFFHRGVEEREDARVVDKTDARG